MSSAVSITALVPAEGRQDVLVVPTPEGGWTLPTITVKRDDPIEWRVAMLAEQHGVTSPFLRRTAAIPAGGTPTRIVKEFEALSPASGSWLSLADLAKLDVPDNLIGPLQRWADEQRGAGISPLRPAWARPGWYRQVSRWIAEQLRAHGIEPDGAPRIVQQWAISSVLRQPSNAGDFYLKAVFGSPGRAFWHEPKLTAELASMHPGQVPEVVAIDSAQGLMLMPDMKLTSLNDRPVATWDVALRKLAQIQRAWVGRDADLLALGCPDRGARVLADQLSDALAYDMHPPALDDIESARLVALLAEFQRLCEAVATGPVPSTLAHGDIHAGNAGVRDDGSVCLYDWSDGALSHPFLDVAYFIARLPEPDQHALWEAYLPEWQEYAPLAELRTLIPAATVLSCLYQVITYQGIVRNLDPADRFVFANGVGSWWRRALAAWDALDARRSSDHQRSGSDPAPERT